VVFFLFNSVSNKLKNLVSDLDVKFLYFSVNKHNKFIKVYKNLVTLNLTGTCIVYKISCKDCEASCGPN